MFICIKQLRKMKQKQQHRKKMKKRRKLSQIIPTKHLTGVETENKSRIRNRWNGDLVGTS